MFLALGLNVKWAVKRSLCGTEGQYAETSEAK